MYIASSTSPSPKISGRFLHYLPWVEGAGQRADTKVSFPPIKGFTAP